MLCRFTDALQQEAVYVNSLTVTTVQPYAPSGTHINFDQGHIIWVEEDIEHVAAKLNGVVDA